MHPPVKLDSLSLIAIAHRSLWWCSSQWEFSNKGFDLMETGSNRPVDHVTNDFFPSQIKFEKNTFEKFHFLIQIIMNWPLQIFAPVMTAMLS